MESLSSLIRRATQSNSLDETLLDPHQKIYLIAKLRIMDKERQAETEAERDAFRALARVAMAALPTGIHRSRGVEKLVRITFKQDISMVSARTDFNCRTEQLLDYQERVRASLRVVRESLKSALENMLERR